MGYTRDGHESFLSELLQARRGGGEMPRRHLRLGAVVGWLELDLLEGSFYHQHAPNRGDEVRYASVSC